MSEFTPELTEGLGLEVLWVVSLCPQLKAKKSLCGHSPIFTQYGLKGLLWNLIFFLGIL